MGHFQSLWFPALSATFSRIAHRQWLSVTLVGLLGFIGSAAIAFITGIPSPYAHDEFSYLLAADTFAHGRLTNPTHPMWVHFESFHIIHQPTYMSKYPPGQGLALAAGQVLAGHPIWGVWMSFGLMCAAICWMLYAWVPPRWAVLGGILAFINPILGISGYWAQSYWGGAVAATGGALVLGALRRIIKRPSMHNALVMGAGLAILANSRPYEGLLISLPAGVVLFVWMLSKRGPALRVSVGRIVIPLVIVLALTATAMALYNLRITGRVFRVPYQVHEETYAIAPLFLWQGLRPEPVYRHKIIGDFHRNLGRNIYKMHYSIVIVILKNIYYSGAWALYSLNVFAVPLISMPFVTLRWALRNHWASFALLTYGVLMCGLLQETYIYLHYFAPLISLNYFFGLQGIRLWNWHNRRKRAGQLMLWLVPFLGAATLITSLYGKLNADDASEWNKRRANIVEQLKKLQGRHLIIVSYASQHVADEEWVYNEAKIDNAKVVWAREMDTSQNCELMEYFKHRHVWLLEIDNDQSPPKLTPYPSDICQKNYSNGQAKEVHSP